MGVADLNRGSVRERGLQPAAAKRQIAGSSSTHLSWPLLPDSGRSQAQR